MACAAKPQTRPMRGKRSCLDWRLDLRALESSNFNDQCSGVGERAWVGGLFQSKSDASKEVCIVVGELPHSSRIESFVFDPNVNFPEWPDDCTDSQDTLQWCEMNSAGTGIYGTSSLVENVKT